MTFSGIWTESRLERLWLTNDVLQFFPGVVFEFLICQRKDPLVDVCQRERGLFAGLITHSAGSAVRESSSTRAVQETAHLGEWALFVVSVRQQDAPASVRRPPYGVLGTEYSHKNPGMPCKLPVRRVPK